MNAIKNPTHARIQQLQTLVKASSNLHINSALLDYSGVVEYYPEELVMTVRAGTPIAQIKKQLESNNQVLPFYTDNDNTSIGAVYANGGQDLSDSVLGVQIIDGNGELLNFGGQVIKNVAGYDVARLLVGSKGRLAIITQISFKVLPSTYVGKLSPPIKNKSSSTLHNEIEQKLKFVFDPRGIFK
ncbi:MAG: FAD-binding protein [Gammaproteobacteria bacterium]|uniref:Glycolate oxidase FAD binding subunit n=1 Tax=endosymbiont of Bathymodiolus septemdierum str. Myojin knoll TaxID=1303921 RepID=A0A0P0USS4_9GAMM|nr:FAD-binding protein [Bathymodiolus septemdierum thioautotrophic gill symbiont]RUA06314.1 MAG: FAD-binding protein [Gammaproteobacteria bacterium]BAS68154.1 glycolate oxidase FAD binding subunit [endosymbiont of Bathymodiolus septemdierum str. Myojin knoll]